MLDSKLRKLRTQFNIKSPTDWQNVRPEWILSVDDIGEATLNHLRLYLAGLGLTLLNDGTPSQWQKLLGRTRFGGLQVSDSDDSETCPFTVVIDTQEKHPFSFVGFRRDAKNNRRPLAVPVVYESLGAHHGDYSIKGYEQHVSVERKSLADAQGTFLGWGERRDRFVEELEWLAGIECSAVVIECTRGQLLASAPSRGAKSNQENAKILFRQVMAWEQDFRVPFVFCDDRRLAEMYTLRLLERFFRKKLEEARAVARFDAAKLERVLAEL